MASLEELKQKLNSDGWSDRRDAVRELGQMKDQRDLVVPLLKERLTIDDIGTVIGESVKALEQLQALDDKVFNALERRLDDEKWPVRDAAVQGLLRFSKPQRSEVIGLLKRRLVADDDDVVVRDTIEGLHELGITIENMCYLIRRNPHFPSEFVTRGLWNSDVAWQVVKQVLERDWRYQYWWYTQPKPRSWWLLSRRERQDFDSPMALERVFHVFMEHKFYFDFFDILERYLHRPWRGSLWPPPLLINPRWPFACHDFEELMSLRVEQNVTYEEVNTLRFRFLDVLVSDSEGRPIGEWARDFMREFQQDWDELLHTEEQLDRIRDEISDLRRQQEEIIHEVERRTEGEWRWERGEPPQLPQDLQGQWNEITERLRCLEGDEEPGKLQRLRRPLEDATERLLPQLRERGVRFKVIEVEGVLGEYNFFERKVTLYQPMIVLAAADLKGSINRDGKEIYEALYTLTEMHETAHATAHLGLDSDSNMWDEPERGTSELHETIAQYYTYKLIEKLEDRSLEEVFLALNEKQPERYKFWRYLKDLSPNRVRDFLIGKRIGWFRWELVSIAHQAAQVLGSSASLLKTCLSSVEFDAFMRGLVPIAARFENAQSLPAVCEAAEELIQHCETHPFVKELIELALPRGFHAPAYRALLLVSNIVEGEPSKGPTLRLTINQIKNAQALSLTASQLLLRNEIIHGLRAAPELKAYTAHDKAQELAKYLPADRNEAIRLVEELSQIVRSG